MPCAGRPMATCSFCNSTNSKIITNYYTDNSEIVRHRRCRDCGRLFMTVQECEVTLDPTLTKVIWASSSDREARKKKQITLERIQPQHQSTNA